MELDACADGRVCVAWVMPMGHAWECGARPGMTVVSIDGRPVVADALPESYVAATVSDARGERIEILVRRGTTADPGVQISLSILGALFALLAMTVVVRRPDHPAARLFAVFGAFTSVALAAGLASADTKPVWILVVQFVSIVGLAVTLPLFMFALVENLRTLKVSLWPLGTIFGSAAVLVLAYAFSVLVMPAAYDVIRVVTRIYLAAAVLAAVAVAVRGLRHTEITRRQSTRLALFGMALGAMPSIFLTILPQALGIGTPVPAHFTVMLWGFIPATLAYAILRHQLLGIRTLVHRGMVYAVASMGLLVVVSLGASVFLVRAGGESPSVGRVVLFVMLAALLFHPLRLGAHWLIGRYVYEVVDSRDLIEVVRDELIESRDFVDVSVVIVKRMTQALQLESALLAVGATPEEAEVRAAVGERCDEILREAYPLVRKQVQTRSGSSLLRVRWKADSMIVAPLRVSGETLGFLYLGPRARGEVFLGDESKFIATVVPILAMTLHETRLLEEVRGLNERLVTAEEAERARIAQDIHDGPLQKAILLGGVLGAPVANSSGLARQLVAELREVCARLRPAILDDLGLVPALEWLLEEVAEHSTTATKLSVGDIADDERLPSELELALFRVTQEAVSNAIKHGKAGRVGVRLRRANGAVSLRIIDDGAGFPEPDRCRSGLGLPGMRERIRQVGGTVTIESESGRGATVHALVPLCQSRLETA